MIRKLYKKHFAIFDPSSAIIPFWGITFANFFVLPMFIPAIVAQSEDPTSYPIIFTMMLSLIPVAVVLYFIPLYDRIMQWVIDFVTTGDIDKPHLIGGMIFGSAYRAPNINSELYAYRSQTLYHRLGGINSLLVFPLQILVWIISFPVLIPYVVGILTIIGLGAAVLYGARKTYTLSKKLSSHVNDPDAHKKIDTAE